MCSRSTSFISSEQLICNMCILLPTGRSTHNYSCGKAGNKWPRPRRGSQSPSPPCSSACELPRPEGCHCCADDTTLRTWVQRIGVRPGVQENACTYSWPKPSLLAFAVPQGLRAEAFWVQRMAAPSVPVTLCCLSAAVQTKRIIGLGAKLCGQTQQVTACTASKAKLACCDG